MMITINMIVIVKTTMTTIISKIIGDMTMPTTTMTMTAAFVIASQVANINQIISSGRQATGVQTADVLRVSVRVVGHLSDPMSLPKTSTARSIPAPAGRPDNNSNQQPDSQHAKRRPICHWLRRATMTNMWLQHVMTDFGDGRRLSKLVTTIDICVAVVVSIVCKTTRQQQ